VLEATRAPAAKHGLDQFTTLLDVFLGHIWMPDAAAVT